MIALRAKKIYDGTMNDPLADAVIFLDQDKIVEIVTDQEAAKNLASRQGIQITDTKAYMTPGLIDSHVHLMLPGDGTAGEDQMQHFPMQEIQMMAYENAMIGLHGGVTTMCDVGSYNGDAVYVRNYFLRKHTGPDILVGGMPLTSTNGHCYYMGGEADGDLEIKKLIRGQMKKGIDFVKLMATAGGTKGISQADPFSQEELNTAVEESHRLGFKITMHASRMPGLRKVVKSGTDRIEHCQFVDGGRLIEDAALAEEIARRGIYPCHTLAVNVSGLYSHFKKKSQELWSEQERKDYEWQKLCTELMPEQLAFQRKYGVPTIGGSDAGWKYTLFENAMQISMEMMVHAGMTEKEVIHSCTGLCAKAIGIEKRTGTIQPGKQADMLLLKKDPGQDIRAFYEIDTVIKNGKIIR